MKKRALAVVLVWAIFVSFVWQFRIKSYADPFTASQIASTAYAMMQSWGISFTSGAATASGMNDFMSGQVNDYVNSQGGSIADIFTGNIAVDLAGKLVVGQQMYNAIKGFADWLIDKFGLSEEETELSPGFIEGWTVEFSHPTVYQDKNVYQTVTFYKNGVEQFHESSHYYGTYTFEIKSSSSKFNLWVNVPYTYMKKDYTYSTVLETVDVVPNTLSWDGSDYVEPTVLNPDKEWTGTIGGYSTPDTNLDQLLGGIDQAMADNNLVVDGEVIDVPVPPTPVPEPVAPDTPLQDVPWEGLNDLINSNTGEITDSIGEAASDITGAIEGTQEAVESLEGLIAESLAVPGAQDINERKFNLSTLFPFCIPFDIYRMLQAFDGTPEAPHVQLPFVIQSLGFSYTFDLDFSAFDPVASIMRTVEFIAFGVFLAFATSKVIRW